MEDQIQVSFDEQINELIKGILRGETLLSYSSLSNFAETPRDFIKYKFKKLERTDDMLFGSIFHCLVLEPKEFYNRYFVIDDVAKKMEIGGAKPGATSAYKGWYEEQCMRAAELKREVVLNSDYEAATIMAGNVINNSAARRVMDICNEREKGIEWEYGNYKWRGFIDGYGSKAKFDLKKVQDANPRKVMRDILSMRYYLQAAMYRTGDPDFEADEDYYIIAADKNDGVSVNQLKPDLLAKGHAEYDYLVSKFSECILSNKWEASYEFFADRFDSIYDVSRGWL